MGCAGDYVKQEVGDVLLVCSMSAAVIGEILSETSENAQRRLGYKDMLY
jgi:NTP pyrophosphatase (non-canonical NTP hydrolase)